MKFIKKTNGYTIVEVMIASSIMLFVMLAVIAFFITSQRSYSRESKEINIQRDAGLAMEKMVRGVTGIGGLMSATSFTIPSSSQINFTLSSGNSCSFYFFDQDSNLNTLEDNFLRYDPDTTTAGDEYNLIDHVNNITFTSSGDLITISLTLRETDRGNNIDYTTGTDVYIRNN